MTDKPTLIVVGSIALMLLLIIGVLAYFAGTLTLKNVAIAILIVPLGVLFLVLINLNNSAQYGVLSDEEKKRDLAKYADKDDT